MMARHWTASTASPRTALGRALEQELRRPAPARRSAPEPDPAKALERDLERLRATPAGRALAAATREAAAQALEAFAADSGVRAAERRLARLERTLRVELGCPPTARREQALLELESEIPSARRALASAREAQVGAAAQRAEADRLRARLA